MYLLNYLSLQFAQNIFINVARYRTGVTVVGPVDGVNVTFRTPGMEKFVQNLPFLDISVYYNGLRLTLLDDYVAVESGGSGAGFDTIVMSIPPLPGDHLLADYVLA